MLELEKTSAVRLTPASFYLLNSAGITKMLSSSVTGKPQSAKLLVTRSMEGTEEFYVNIAFEFSPTPIVTESFFGLDRGAAMIGAATGIEFRVKCGNGLIFTVSLLPTRCVLHQRRVAEAQRDGKRAFNFRLRGRRAKIILGEYANKLITKAIEHKSQIVLEKLDAKIFSRHFLKQSQIRKLHDMLTYKAERAGLPAPIEVPAAYTSQTCARCGHHDPANRPHVDADGRAIQHLFRCTGCGYTANADENASEIIALRGLHQTQYGGRFQKFDVFRVWLQSQIGRDTSADSHPAGAVLSSA